MHRIFTFAVLLPSFVDIAYSQTIDPNSVPIATRDGWCQAQITQCPLICLELPGENSAGTDANTCDATSLTYSCVCANGQSPNASDYTQTLPYFICTQYNTNCIANCNGDTTCQSACTQDHPCGAQNPIKVNTSTITTMSSTSSVGATAVSTASGGGAVYTGFGGAATTTTAGGGGGGGGSKSAATTILLNLGQLYGLGVIIAGFLAGFSLL